MSSSDNALISARKNSLLKLSIDIRVKTTVVRGFSSGISSLSPGCATLVTALVWLPNQGQVDWPFEDKPI